MVFIKEKPLILAPWTLAPVKCSLNSLILILLEPFSYLYLNRSWYWDFRVDIKKTNTQIQHCINVIFLLAILYPFIFVFTVLLTQKGCSIGRYLSILKSPTSFLVTKLYIWPNYRTSILMQVMLKNDCWIYKYHLGFSFTHIFNYSLFLLPFLLD